MNKLIWWYYRWMDRRDVKRLIRLYKKHPELYEEDRDLFRSGQAGYEEEV